MHACPHIYKQTDTGTEKSWKTLWARRHEKVFKICESNTTTSSSLLFLRQNSFGKTLHSMLKNNGREFKKSSTIPIKSILKRNYRWFQKIVAPTSVRSTWTTQGRSCVLRITVLDVSGTVTGCDVWSTVRQKHVTEATHPIPNKKQREKDRSSRQGYTLNGTFPPPRPHLLKFLEHSKIALPAGTKSPIHQPSPDTSSPDTNTDPTFPTAMNDLLEKEYCTCMDTEKHCLEVV